MPSRMLLTFHVFLAFFTVQASWPIDDAASLVQAHLSEPVTLAAAPAAAAAVAAAAAPAAAAESESANLYRVRIQKTHGADHVCLTEIQFYDSSDATLTAKAVSASSCWGCAIDCTSCTATYGNFNVLFDNIATNSTPQDYFCSSFGRFTDSVADTEDAAAFTFSLVQSPAAFALRYGEIKGDAIAQDFVLEEQNANGEWQVVSVVNGQDKRLTQRAQVQSQAGASQRWWEYEDPNCMRDYDAYGKDENLSVALNSSGYSEDDKAVFSTTAQGASVHGSFGELSVGGVAYQARQIVAHFPSQRKVGEVGLPAMGELHVIHQQSPADNQEGILILVIPLVLPPSKETNPTDRWFANIVGADKTVPKTGAPRTLSEPMSLSVFAEQIAEGAYEVKNCTLANNVTGVVNADAPRWIVLRKPAIVTGEVVQAFEGAFPFLDARAAAAVFSPAVFKQDAPASNSLYGRDAGFGAEAPAPDSVVTVTEDAGAGIFVEPDSGGARWMPNPKYSAGKSDYMSTGEWYVPPGAMLQVKKR